MMMALLLLALVAGAIYSRLSPTAEQIDPAELAASDTLEEQIELVVTPEPPKEPSLQPSLLDRADKLAADRALAPPSGSDPESRDPTRVARSAANPSTDTANSTGTETSTRTAAEATSREASIRFSDDMLIVNEYTAIPAAASSAIKPASPAAPARSDTDRNSSRSSDAPASLEPSLPPAAKVRQADSFVAP